ncbi:hypothetical protein [Labrys wisconsinensis]|uniref:Uncharacterized protein n=1 Tax=Labrys wisconsinensis TaxID=425677 RepID=A0ABU0JEU9_9HYPH|nr:hypothetical protein [Labrys wisconsinensis]MDQ0472809.1 hypothetical protein [Labrys wisconsinensis]
METSLLAAVHAAANPETAPAAPPAPAMASAQAIEAARAEGHKAGLAAGASAERARGKAILGSDAAKSRRELAEHLAFETELSVEAAAAILVKAPEEAKGARLDGRVPNPNIAPDAAPAADKNNDPAERLMGALDRVAGKAA